MDGQIKQPRQELKQKALLSGGEVSPPWPTLEIDQELAAVGRRAKEAKLDVLGCLIDTARLEAANAARGTDLYPLAATRFGVTD